MKEQIFSYMQYQENEIVRLADDLIGANTVNPPGNERLAVNIVETYFKTHDIRYDIFEKLREDQI